ncbi:P-loop containing nucleoside triphosphate hydrolase protein [Mycena galopus ATCC 62051]|nr:P-loop containing nucleoside triphosphate hydrolase protein [Mycena galopus ATCC 62051]
MLTRDGIFRILTRNPKLLYELVNEARASFMKANSPYVLVHQADTNYIPENPWTIITRKAPRPLSSVILPDGVSETLITDVQGFLEDEDLYVKRGTPYRRGYMLSGPPGSGKTSTVIALAGALHLDIYLLSLGSRFMDDTFLQRAVSTIPRRSILLIEDIDCSVDSRDNDAREDTAGDGITVSRPLGAERRASITLSGLLNVIDGVGSEEGRLFFTTSNHSDRLDPAFLRPGRIDIQIQFELATTDQVAALFRHFFGPFAWSSTPDAEFPPPSEEEVASLADTFAKAIPPKEFSTAEIQGYLQLHKTSPVTAVWGAGPWVEQVRADRCARADRETERRRRVE